MLTVQVGQCGNQLGRALFAKLAAETESTDSDSLCGSSGFFRSPSDGRDGGGAARRARAVLIDMEPKVVQQCMQPQGGWAYDPRNTLTQQSGSGNNWAYGYAVHGAQAESALLDLIQAEAERCDLLKGFLTMQSAAGGTGSGLGSFLAETLADHFPTCDRLNAVVWPYQSGEVIVQNYNAVLTTASLVDAAHGVLVLHNDIATAACQKLLRIAHPSFEELNQVLATHLAAALLPVDRTASRRQTDPFSEICRQLCSHPAFKLLDVKTVPLMPHRSKKFTTHTWPGLLKYLHQMQVANEPLEEGIDWTISLDNEQGRRWNRAVGSVVIVRGTGAIDADVTAFRDPRIYAPWMTVPVSCLTSSSHFNSYDKSATIISNSKASVATLAATADKAYQMFVHGAYLHQYERYQVDREFFQQAFMRVDQVVQSYNSL